MSYTFSRKIIFKKAALDFFSVMKILVPPFLNEIFLSKPLFLKNVTFLYYKSLLMNICLLGWAEGINLSTSDDTPRWFPLNYCEEIDSAHMRRKNLMQRYRLINAGQELISAAKR